MRAVERNLFRSPPRFWLLFLRLSRAAPPRTEQVPFYGRTEQVPFYGGLALAAQPRLAHPKTCTSSRRDLYLPVRIDCLRFPTNANPRQRGDAKPWANVPGSHDRALVARLPKESPHDLLDSAPDPPP